MDVLTRRIDKKGRLTLPSDYAGCLVTVERQGDSLVVRKAKERPRRKYRLRDLLARITPENIHPETDWGKAVGKEVL
jgi:antitoxin component of MazEF toxin-antitoxin module